MFHLQNTHLHIVAMNFFYQNEGFAKVLIAQFDSMITWTFKKNDHILFIVLFCLSFLLTPVCAFFQKAKIYSW